MQLRAQKLIESRKAILASAVALIGSSGFSHTTTAAVAAHAGYAHGTVFLHFPTRQKLMDEAIHEMGRQLTDALYPSATQFENLSDALAAHMDAIERKGAIYRTLLRELPQLSPKARRTWTGIQSAVSQHLSEVVRKEIEMGRIKPLQPGLLFNTWIGLLHHYLLNEEMFSHSGRLLQHQKTTLLRHFMDLVRISHG